MSFSCPRCYAQNEGGYCAGCGYQSPSNAFGSMMREMQRPVTPRIPPTAEEKDKSFANLLGVIVAAAAFWYAGINGYAADSSVLFALFSGIASASVLRRMKYVVRPLRWITSAVIVCALIGLVLTISR